MSAPSTPLERLTAAVPPDGNPDRLCKVAPADVLAVAAGVGPDEVVAALVKGAKGAGPSPAGGVVHQPAGALRHLLSLAAR